MISVFLAGLGGGGGGGGDEMVVGHVGRVVVTALYFSWAAAASAANRTFLHDGGGIILHARCPRVRWASSPVGLHCRLASESDA